MGKWLVFEKMISVPDGSLFLLFGSGSNGRSLGSIFATSGSERACSKFCPEFEKRYPGFCAPYPLFPRFWAFGAKEGFSR